MKLGISTKCFGGISTGEAAEKIKKSGYEAVELCMCQSDAPYRHYNATGYSEAPGKEEFCEICRKYTDKDLEIASLGVNINLWCGGISQQMLARQSMVDYMELAVHGGIGCISTELGFSIASRPIRGSTVSRKSYTADEISRLESAFCFLSLEAAKRGLAVCIHPCEADPVWSAAGESKGRLYADFISKVEEMSGISGVLKLALCPFSFGEEGVYNKGDFSGLEKQTALIYIKERTPDSRYFTHAGANAGGGFGLSEWRNYFAMFENADYAIVEYVDDRKAAHVCSYISGAMK